MKTHSIGCLNYTPGLPSHFSMWMRFSRLFILCPYMARKGRFYQKISHDDGLGGPHICTAKTHPYRAQYELQFSSACDMRVRGCTCCCLLVFVTCKAMYRLQQSWTSLIFLAKLLTIVNVLLACILTPGSCECFYQLVFFFLTFNGTFSLKRSFIREFIFFVLMQSDQYRVIPPAVHVAKVKQRRQYFV